MSPWAKIEKTEPVNLEHIISEEIARKLEEKELKKLIRSYEIIDISTTKLDDKEVEQNVSVVADEDFEKEAEAVRDNKDVLNREVETFVNCGYKKVNGVTLTPYDLILSGKDNREKKKLIKSFKILSTCNKSTDDANFKMDAYTALLLDKLMNTQKVSKVNGVTHVGRKAILLHGNSDTEEHTGSKECIIKLFKISPPEPEKKVSNQRRRYRCFIIYHDQEEKNKKPKEPKFEDKFDEQKTRQTAQNMALNEMKRLNKLREVGVKCPEVIALRRHVLVTTFIGEKGESAEKLAHTTLGDEDYFEAYTQVVQMMKSCYKKARVIHGNLSEDNILWHQNQCYFIDLSQSVEPSHPKSLYILMKDCIRVTKFFAGKNVNCDALELFKEVANYEFTDRIALMELRKKRAL